MKNITMASIQKDLETIRDIAAKYSDAIWENQEGQEAHFDNQSKFVKVMMCGIRGNLYAVEEALRRLTEAGIIEDPEERTKK